MVALINNTKAESGNLLQRFDFLHSSFALVPGLFDR
jgi:hypothetical protein